MKFLSIILLIAGLSFLGCASQSLTFKDYQEDIASQEWRIQRVAEYNSQLEKGLITVNDYDRYLEDIKTIAEMDSIYREAREKYR